MGQAAPLTGLDDANRHDRASLWPFAVITKDSGVLTAQPFAIMEKARLRFAGARVEPQPGAEVLLAPPMNMIRSVPVLAHRIVLALLIEQLCDRPELQRQGAVAS